MRMGRDVLRCRADIIIIRDKRKVGGEREGGGGRGGGTMKA